MRRQFYRLYNLLASYPVIALLLIATVALVYFGQQYRPLESMRQIKLTQSMQLRQEQKDLEKELTSTEQKDLRKRYILFNQSFISKDEANAQLLKESLAPAFLAHGWTLQNPPSDAAVPELVIIETGKNTIDTGNDEIIINGATLNLWASALNKPSTNEEPFLPLYSLTECIKYLWSRPPTHEYQHIKIVRTTEGFALEASLFFPLIDPSIELNEI
ncbi:MAG: hypothetical protein VXZ45_04340 [Verrucomicrobiota bacterium]|nr:hypothetical protein [Verrucomicrobiota bacterium]